MSSLPVPVRLRPVLLKCSRVDIELSGNAREKLIRRVRHLEGAVSLVAKLDDASGLVELTAGEKGFLVVAITAWAEAGGRNRVPGELIRLQTTLLGDLYYPVEEPDEPEVPEALVEPPPAAPAEPETDPEAEARHAALAGIHRDLEQHLEALGELDGGSLGRARAALRRTVAELAAALER